jgi:hypothetical protein
VPECQLTAALFEERERERVKPSVAQTPGSSMNAALGGVSAGGMGTPLFDVTQSGGGPSALVASHSTGNAGGVTLSKFSFDVCREKHGGHLPPLRICADVGPIAMPAAMSKTNQRTLRNRVGLNVRFTFSTIAAGVQPTLLPRIAEGCQFSVILFVRQQ